jgi:hypothetical protein
LRSEHPELSRRERHDHTPEVLSLAWDGGPPGLSGSIGIVSGHERSELVLGAREAALAGDGTRLADVLEVHSQRQPLKRPRIPGEDPAGVTDSVSPVLEVTYRGAVLAEATIRDEGLCVGLPFAGGSLDPGGFAASAYFSPGVAPSRLATLVIIRQPELSDLEQRALEGLQSEISEIGHRRVAATAEVERLLELRTGLVLAGREP